MPEFNEPKRRKARPAPPPKTKKPKPQKAPKQPKPQNQPKPKAQKQVKRRRPSMAIYYIMFFFVAVVILSGLSVTVLFNLQDIVTEGDSRYTSEQIIAASGIKTGVNLIRFNTDDSRQRIIDSLVYVDEVVIRKNPLANRITIEVTGAEEMAAVAYDNAFLVISKNGRILESTRRHTGLPIIHGFEAYEPVVGGRISSEETRKTELAFIIMQTIEKVGLEEILSINIEDFLDITLNYMNRVTVEIGPETQLEEKLRVAVRLLNYEIDINERGTLILLNPLQAVFSPE